MFSSVSDKIKSFIFQPPKDARGSNVSRKRKRLAIDTDDQDSDIEIIEVKKARKESTNTFWNYLKLPVDKMAEWVRHRGSTSFSTDFHIRQLPENSRWREGPPRSLVNHSGNQPTVKVPTTNGGSSHSQVHSRPPLHKPIGNPVEYPRVNGDRSLNSRQVQTDKHMRCRPKMFEPKNKRISTAQECVRMEEKNRYRELLQAYVPSVMLDDQKPNKDVVPRSRWKIPSTFNFSSNNLFGDSLLGNNTSIGSTSVFASELKSQSASPRPPISSTILTTRRRNVLDVLQSTPMSTPVKEERKMSNLRIHQQEVVIPDDKDDEISQRLSPVLDTCTDLEFKSSPYANTEWIEDLKSKYSSEVRERKRQIAEQEIKAKVYAEQRKEKDDNLEKRIREQMRIHSEEPAVLEEPPPIELESEEEEEEQLPDLTSEMENVIANAVKAFPPDQVLVEGYRLQITRKDMSTLSGLNWLNDEVINFYMNMLMERGELDGRPKVYAFNTFFYPKLMSGGHSAVRRWTRKVDIFAQDYVLIPVHLGVHWCLSIIDLKQKKIRYFDSMGGQNAKCLQALRKYLQDESQDKKKRPFDFSGWQLHMERDIPQQMNGSDCGMFACKFAEYVTREASVTFTQANMPYFRKRMVYEIMTKSLLQ